MAEKKMKKPSIDWKIAADRVTIGERFELESLPGFWVQTRRYTKQGEAEILAAQTRSIVKSKAIAASIIDGMPEPESEAERIMGVSDKMKKDIAMQVMEHATADMVGKVEENTLRLVYGIEATNMTDNGKPSSAWAAEIMQYSDVANEILARVTEQNLPLALRLSRKSETLQTGSSTAANSKMIGATAPAP